MTAHTGSYGCKCTMCRARRARYARELHRKQREGIPRRVPLGPAKQHVEWLMDRGMPGTYIAQVAGVSHPTILRVRRLDGETLIGKRIADALLAVQFDVSALQPGAHVDATGSRRRVQALATRGWSLPQIAARIGVDPTSLRVHQPNRRFIQKRNADAIKALYDELWDQEPPTGTSQELRVARYTKTWARKSGFMPPGAWDDDMIDDPGAQPDLGEKVRANANAREEIAWLRSFGKTNEQIALHMGKTSDYVRAQLRETA